MVERGAGKVDVRVHQVVKSLDGAVVADGEVWHGFTLVDGLIAGMELGGEAGEGVASAFSSSRG